MHNTNEPFELWMGFVFLKINIQNSKTLVANKC
jgi:hypothetical protein